MPNYTKIAIRGAFAVVLITALGAALGYVLRAILARYLSVEDFGIFYAVFGFFGAVSVFTTLGYNRALIKFIPEFEHKKKDWAIKSSLLYVMGIFALTHAVLLILIFFGANFLSEHLFHTQKASLVLKVLALSFLFDNFLSIIQCALQGFKRMALFSSVDPLRLTVVGILTLFAFSHGYSLEAPIFSYLAANIVLFLIFWLILQKSVFPQFSSVSFKKDQKLFKSLTSYSMFMMLAGSGIILISYTDTLFLTYFAGVVAVGYYNVAAPTAKILTYLPNAIAGILTPLSSELWAKRKFTQLRNGMNLLYKYTMMIALPLVLIMLAYPDVIIRILYTDAYLPAIPAFRIFALSMIFATINLIHIPFFSGTGNPHTYSKMIFFGAATNFLMSALLIPFFGIIGAALSTFSSYLMMFIVSFYYMRKSIGIRFPLWLWARTLLCGGIFTLSIFGLRFIPISNAYLELVMVLPLAGIIYLLSLFALRVLHVSEVKELLKKSHAH